MKIRVSLVAGAGGFIGGHLCRALQQRGDRVIGVDIKPVEEWWQQTADECLVRDVSKLDCANEVMVLAQGDELSVWNLAADTGGIGFIESNRARCMLNVLINTHLLMAAKDHGAHRYFFASSACVYSAAHQNEHIWLKEGDVRPFDPEDGYGWEKLFSERMCRHFREDFGLQTRIARYHNVYGPHGSWGDGREKAPAALCRKAIEAKQTGEMGIWGDGSCERSFLYVDDCVRLTMALAESDFADPVNIGNDETVTVQQLADHACGLAGVTPRFIYDTKKPQGVPCRSSDNTLCRNVLGDNERVLLESGLRQTFDWVNKCIDGAD